MTARRLRAGPRLCRASGGKRDSTEERVSLGSLRPFLRVQPRRELADALSCWVHQRRNLNNCVVYDKSADVGFPDFDCEKG